MFSKSKLTRQIAKTWEIQINLATGNKEAPIRYSESPLS
jgi:hypothetical protein